MSVLGTMLGSVPLKIAAGAPSTAYVSPQGQMPTPTMSAEEMAMRAEDNRLRGLTPGTAAPPQPAPAPTGFGPTDSRLLRALGG